MISLSLCAIFAFAWAIEKPDKVSCIYGVNPALGSFMVKTSLLDNLARLAKAGVPLGLHYCDRNDPRFNYNTKVVERRYRDLGGSFTALFHEQAERPVLSVADEQQVVAFIIEKAKLSKFVADPSPKPAEKTGHDTRPKVEH